MRLAAQRQVQVSKLRAVPGKCSKISLCSFAVSHRRAASVRGTNGVTFVVEK